jgi:hypothetical protein
MKSEDEFEEQDRRIAAVIGEDDAGAAGRWFSHLRANLSLPCEVTGSEDFQWEEPYALGVWSQTEYRKLQKTQPSYRDIFILESIQEKAHSEWAMFADDIGANVRRKSDGARFILGLCEIRAVKEDRRNQQLFVDYSCWFVNYR